MSNMGIECDGFGADTLHMARLLDASRTGKKTYGLDNLSSDYNVSEGGAGPLSVMWEALDREPQLQNHMFEQVCLPATVHGCFSPCRSCASSPQRRSSRSLHARC